MQAIWQALVGNFAVAGLAISVWAHISTRLGKFWPGCEQFAFGIIMGGGAIASIMLSVELSPGVYIDLRSSLIATAGLFGGPVSAVVASCIAVIYRLSIGGSAALDGVISIVVVAILGLGANVLTRKREPVLLDVTLTAVAVGGALVAMMVLLPALSHAHALKLAGSPLLILNFAAMEVCGFVFIQVRRNELERDILRAAFSQAPDFLFVKDRDSKFVVANKNVAVFNKFNSPSELIGLSDFNLTTPPRAEELYHCEQELMRSGIAQTNYVEHIGDRSFQSSKVPLRDSAGRIIGLAGVTRDITERELLERDLRESKNLLSHAMAGMSDGFAMFDRQGVLLFCNEQYRQAFPLSADVRVPGAHITDILRRIVETGERADTPSTVDENWIRKAGATLHNNKDEEIQLSNGHWRSLRTRLTADGAAIVVVSDITTTKQAEMSLRISAEQLKSLAQTDGLTGVVNRRAFDEILVNEMARRARSGTSLSLLMIDVDRFKAYNDTYGHPAGDQCLRLVSECLQHAAKRPADIVARYGGEEFVIVLPATDEAGAVAVAEEFMSSLRSRNIVHSASEFGRVTASIGIACIGGRVGGKPDPADLVARADSALYEAKMQGRDRINKWQRAEAEHSIRNAG